MSLDEEGARELVRRAVLGEVPMDDAELRRALLSHPEVRRELEELRQAQALLDAAGSTERSTLEQAQTQLAPHLDVARVLHRLAKETQARPRPWPWLLGLLAAMTLLAMGWWLRGREEPAPPPREVLDTTRLEVVGCTRVPGGFVLAWRADDEASHYKVVVTGTGLRLESDAVVEARWEIPQDLARDWPSPVSFTVTAYDPAGMPLRRSPVRTFAWPP